MNWIKSAWRGKEPLWKVFWVYGALGTIAVKLLFILTFTIIGVQPPWGSPSFTFIGAPPSWGFPTNFIFAYTILGVGAVLGGFPPSKMGTIVILIYMGWFLVAEWRCAFNVKEKFWGYIVRGHVLFTIIGLVVGGVLITQTLVKAASDRHAAIAAPQAGAAPAEPWKNDPIVQPPKISDALPVNTQPKPNDWGDVPIAQPPAPSNPYDKFDAVSTPVAQQKDDFGFQPINAVPQSDVRWDAVVESVLSLFIILFSVVAAIYAYRALKWCIRITSRRLKTRAQRIAYLSLCASLLLFICQLAVYADSTYYFWVGLSECLSFGDSYRHCSHSDVISRSLMYLNVIWLTVSLICTFWWRHIASIRRWVETGAHDK